MNSRRSFFSKVAAIAATVALAPELVFGKLDLGLDRWTGKGIYQMIQECGPVAPHATLDLEEIFQTLYAVKQARKDPNQIEILVEEEFAATFKAHLRQLQKEDQW